MRVRTIIAAIALCAVAVAPLPGAARLPDADWIPNSWGLVPFPTVDQTAGKVGFFHATRRIVADQRVPGRFVLGHSLFGLWLSVPGAGWVSLAPNCLDLVRPPFIEEIVGLLSGCGVEGLAFDPQDPLGLFASTYNIGILDPGIPVTPGGVFRSEIRFGNLRVSTGGLTWRKILAGVRGNALAVKRPNANQQATIVVGRIQKAINDVGTDNNAFCAAVARADNCSPSVYVSPDGGTQWQPRYFEPAPCPNGQGNVFTSSRIVGNLAFDPFNNNVVYAGSNSGLWVSTDNGATWANKLALCGHNPGFAVTNRPDGNGKQRIYAGDFLGRLYVASTDAHGPGGFTPLKLSHAIEGQILSVLLDGRDETERTFWVASWNNPKPTGGGVGGIYKVTDLGNGNAFVEPERRSLLDFIEPALRGAPLPYPLVQDPAWRPSLFLAQHPLEPDLLYASTVFGGVWTRSDGSLF